MHSVSISGKVGSVQELRQVGETYVLNFNLASSEYFGKEKKTVWFKCSLWGQHAENIAQYVEVGKGLFVTGTLKPDEHGNPGVYQTNSGEHRASFELNVDRVEFTTPKGNSESTDNDRNSDDDIPF